MSSLNRYLVKYQSYGNKRQTNCLYEFYILCLLLFYGSITGVLAINKQSFISTGYDWTGESLINLFLALITRVRSGQWCNSYTKSTIKIMYREWVKWYSVNVTINLFYKMCIRYRYNIVLK